MSEEVVESYEERLSRAGKELLNLGKELAEIQLNEEKLEKQSCEKFLKSMVDSSFLDALHFAKDTIDMCLKWGTDHVHGFGLGSDYGQVVCKAKETGDSIGRLLDYLSNVDYLLVPEEDLEEDFYSTEEIQSGFANFCEAHDCRTCPIEKEAHTREMTCPEYYNEYCN